VKLLVFVLLALLLLATLLLNRAYRALPLSELRRRARNRDPRAGTLYRAAAYGEGLEILLWIVGSASASFLVISAANSGWWFAALLVVVAGFFVFSRSLAPMPDWQWRTAALLAKPVAWLLSVLQPVFRPAGSPLGRRRPKHGHSGLYEKEDLLGLLKRQAGQADNRLSEDELAIVRGALSFSDKAVGQVMTPKAKLKMVAINEPIGPHLMDELHASGLSSFPVVKEVSRSASLEVIGTLYLSDLMAHGDSGKVKDVAKAQVYYVNEAQDLRQALGAFLKTKVYMLIVVNNFEEISGALTIEQLLSQILGKELVSEFDRYDDRVAVAGYQEPASEEPEAKD
jgi:CBS domain containing-hemolysin-like protein